VQDNCFRAVAKPTLSLFCASSTANLPIALTANVASGCKFLPFRISSACSSYNTASLSLPTSSSSISSTHYPPPQPQRRAQTLLQGRTTVVTKRTTVCAPCKAVIPQRQASAPISSGPGSCLRRRRSIKRVRRCRRKFRVLVAVLFLTLGGVKKKVVKIT
jgi:hypothetical protein